MPCILSCVLKTHYLARYSLSEAVCHVNRAVCPVPEKYRAFPVIRTVFPTSVCVCFVTVSLISQFVCFLWVCVTFVTVTASPHERLIARNLSF